MTDDDKALVERLRQGHEGPAANRIEALSAENERLRKYVLMWLGVYRDDLSRDAIKNLQVILGAPLGETI